MDLVQSVRKEGSRGSQAIGDNVDVEGIRSSNHRENYLGHSILAPVGRSERRRDQLFWARDKPSANVDEDELRQEFKEAQIRERRALNEALGRPIDEGVEELLNPKPSLPAIPSPIPSKTPKERKERRHKPHHRRHRSRSRSPRRHRHHSSSRSPPRHHRSDRERSRSREDYRHLRRHGERERERNRSRERRPHRRDRSRDKVERRRPRELSRDASPEPYRRREHDESHEREQRHPRHHGLKYSHEEDSFRGKNRDDYYPQRGNRDRAREGSYASDHHRSRPGSDSR
ncbi:hypothetical protein MPH_01608 [Macrophomina phaseolina MS6]|uniref:Multiple myeloma tumor-associated protein 2-like N-terminal domain-containing protein n=1 Tax=Macrophomina phaseolina (strain MS6) TaxID=1126212 RepID=K2SF81_MACPH|nr:hypothetical protein MPH_01608 [Macrophomina phaseolina MS6]